MENGYSSKATAVRGAKRAGIENANIVERDGRWFIETSDQTVETSQPTPQPELSPETQAKVAKVQMMAKEDLAKLASTLPGPKESTPEEIAARRAERRARIDAEKAAVADAPKIPSYKELYRQAPKKSAIDKPVKFVHEYLAKHYGERSRKALIAELVAFGLNVTMCRSQYQIYRRKLGLETKKD